ncbi:formate dehydrogenase subunit gamma [Polynucleobacter sp. JS-Mosq-20-D10]|uniref:formate dehydrogenase subunit gamma n=1 Tax=Polynucleobacter sp. JS-Mosq-20-D10 TaxID=2576922 RepID=UPI001BFD9C89|nr:formate dehydrogenase subunit gamma [Polynucleobacter sp. JS-Mosq-20-D10]QWD99724.1 formate dehydrogenase subunit gamma [Polynucleobacter sp. JS-Mosq-20-D10]
MNRSFISVSRSWALALGVSLSLLSGVVLAERAAMPPLPSPSGIDYPKNLNEIPKGTQAQSQPANTAPKEGAIWDTANSDPYNYVSIPDKEASVLIQRAGQQWRLIRNGVITVYGAWILAIAFFGIAALFLVKGPIKLHAPMSGQKIKRFNGFERLTHWVMAASFIGLATTGMLILWGKYFVMPLMGGAAYGSFLMICKNIHNYSGPLFTLSVVIFFLLFATRNIPGKGDLNWLMTLGGALTGKHPPAGFFNMGEKIWFWFGMVVLGLTISASGFVLDMIVPFMEVQYLRGTMQLANIVHSSASILMTAMAMGHIYIGSIGMQGSSDGMMTGYVDATWAKEHHELWYDKVNK